MKRALCALLLCACGPGGNTLGMGGRYLSDATFDADGTSTSFSTGGNPSVSSYKSHTDETLSMTIESGYDSDAVLTEGTCALKLMGSGSALVLKDTTTCPTTTTNSATAGGATSSTTDVSTITWKAFRVEPGSSNGRVRITGSGQLTGSSKQDAKLKSQYDLSFKLDAQATRVATEK